MRQVKTDKRKKTLLYITVIVILQGFLLLWFSLAATNFLTKEVYTWRAALIFSNAYVFSALLTLVGIVSIFCLKEFLKEEEMKIKNSQLQLEQSRDLIRSLRIQDHDFKNHLNVIKVWAELGDLQSILRYLQGGKITIIDPAAFDEICCPVLQGIFLVVQAKAARLNIKFTVESVITLENFCYSWDKINHIFSNLLNNAIEAVTTQGKSLRNDREIVLYILDSTDNYIFQLWTPTVLPEEINPSRLFEMGYSTKEEPGHGLGLYIAKKLVSELNGTIEVESSSELGTEFQLTLAKQKKGLCPRIES